MTSSTAAPMHRLAAGLTLVLAAGCGASVSSTDAGADAPRGTDAVSAGPTDAPPVADVIDAGVIDASPNAPRLPQGVWRGALQRVCSDGATASPQYETRVTSNEQRTEVESDGLSATMLDRYTFSAPDSAVWLDLQGGELGRCTLNGGEFACRVTADAAVQTRRTQTFAGDALTWDEETSLEGVTCRVQGTLRRP